MLGHCTFEPTEPKAAKNTYMMRKFDQGLCQRDADKIKGLRVAFVVDECRHCPARYAGQSADWRRYIRAPDKTAFLRATGVNMGIEQFGELYKNPKVLGVKFTAGDFYLLERLKKAYPNHLIWAGRCKRYSTIPISF